MRTHALVGIVPMLLILAGCSSFPVAKYPSPASAAPNPGAAAVNRMNVGAFTTSPIQFKEIMCRQVGPIKTPEGEAFSEFIRDSFIRELRRADLYSETSPITITGTITILDFSSVAGTWDSEVTLKSSNAKDMKITDLYRFEASWYGNKACEQAAAAFTPAIQQLLGKIVGSSELKSLAAP